MFSVSEPPQTGISAPTSRRDSRGIVLLGEQRKRKNGQGTRSTPSFRGICVNFDLWWDTVRCAEMWACEHFPGEGLQLRARASEREAAPRPEFAPSPLPRAWLASCPDSLVTPLYLPQMYQTNDQNHRPRTETNTQHRHGSPRRAGEVYRRRMAKSLTSITRNEGTIVELGYNEERFNTLKAGGMHIAPKEP